MSGRARLDAWRDRRRGPLTFRLDGVDYEVPEHPARVWVLAVLSDEPVDLLLDLLADDVADEMWEDALDPDAALDTDLLVQIGRSLLARVTGRPWWQAMYLIATLVEGWDTFIAVARDRGLGDPLDWPVDELVAWVYLRLTQHATPEAKARLDAELDTPPAAVLEGDDDGEGGLVGEEDGWLAMAAQFADGIG